MAAPTTRFLWTTGVMQPTPWIRRFFGRTPCMSCHAIDRPCANPMRAIMIAKSQFDTGVTVQRAATFLHARFVFFLCTSTSNILKPLSRGQHTRQHVWLCANPVTMRLPFRLHSQFCSNMLQRLQRCSPSPSSLFFLSEVSYMCSPLLELLDARYRWHWPPKTAQFLLTLKRASLVANHRPATSFWIKRNQPQGN